MRLGQYTRKALGGAALGLVLLSAAGCSALAVWMGLRVRLDELPVTAVAASLHAKRDDALVTALGPGQSANLVIVATTQDGQRYATVGVGKGKVAFDNYVITASVVQVSPKGVVSLSSDPRVSEGQVAHLRIAPVAHPDVVAELDVPVRYDMAFTANYSGANGTSGFDGLPGSDGSSGTDGAPGTIDPTTGFIGPQGAGGRGSDGGNGGDGDRGGDGAPGLSIHIWVRLQRADAAKPLLQVKVAGGGRESLFLVDPSGGSLTVSDDGGAAGRGGSGGRGGRGGSGGMGSPPGMSGLDGHAGSDGSPGRDGAGGTIAVSVDPAAQPYLGCIKWSNRSGAGQPGPPAVVTVEPVPPLW